jgi:uncharacterized membrane protein
LRRALVATVVTLLVAAALELAVYGKGGHDALSDLPGRFFAWHLHRADWPYLSHPIEYPVVIGYVASVTSFFGRTVATFFLANALVSVALALVITALLHPRGDGRIWRWAAGIPLALYAFHNWDLVALAPAIAGLVAFDRGKDRSSGALLAVGASAKLFPGLFVVPLALVRWCSGDRRGATRLMGAFVLVAVALNLPVAGHSLSAWTHPASFQSARPATWGSLWSWVVRSPGFHGLVGDTTGAVNVLALLATLGGVAVISVLAVRRRLDAFAIGAAATGVLLLANKVYSPNYDLWIVPFFVLLPIARRVWVAFCASDLAIFVLVFGFLHGNWSAGVVDVLLPSLVFIRAVTIIAVILTALQVRSPFAPAHELDLREHHDTEPDRGSRATGAVAWSSASSRRSARAATISSWRIHW